MVSSGLQRAADDNDDDMIVFTYFLRLICFLFLIKANAVQFRIYLTDFHVPFLILFAGLPNIRYIYNITLGPIGAEYDRKETQTKV